MEKKKILFVTQKRNDAIGIVDNEIKKELKNQNYIFDFLELKCKGKYKKQIIWSYIFNIIKLLIYTFKYKEIYFSWENPYVIFIKIFFPYKKIIMCVHHVEDYWGKSIIGKLIIISVDKIVAISNFTKNQLINIGVKKNIIFVNYNGISNNFYLEKIEQFKIYKYILYVGTEVERKNILNLFKSFKLVLERYPDIKMLKLGPSSNINREIILDSFIKKNNLENNIIINRKRFSSDELRRYYSNAICYISVSKLEGFGLTIPEALACECSVIISNIAPFKEIVGDSQIIVDPDNIIEISNGMIKYIENKDFRKIMGENGKSISKKFSWEKNVENLINILEKDK